ncbi:restriction endonuclease subunit S [Acetivibrio thermocellus]|uniref:restriction endonuclease subunit S n=1 Tax=Acetivibrio thermocellus TaxID=1515 RepID=UPI0021AE2F62|nr:restriction endonuclease subunit S [Acetivibrio thermocellus]UWV48021.1 restriction endonuclease subunit S [Acetivibrio thermocellus]
MRFLISSFFSGVIILFLAIKNSSYTLLFYHRRSQLVYIKYFTISYGKCSYAGYLVKFRANSKNCPKFLFYFSKSNIFYIQIQLALVSSTISNFNGNKYANMILPLPSYYEQKAISNFLDQKTAVIDDLIADKEKLIELLQEKRQAIITEAVTKGLNPNVRLKDSGIEWIGKIPEEWEVSSLRWYISIKSGDYISQENIDEEGPIPVIGGNGLMAYTNKANCNFKTIAIGRVGALCGNVHFIDYPSWITDNALYITNLRSKLCIKYLFYVLKALNLNQYANKTAQPLISSSLVKSQVIPIPPIIEQTDIVNYLDIKTAEIDDIISEIKLQIQKLKEYRQSLIYEAVTGKIYVRDYAID